MHNNYYFLRQLSGGLREKLRGWTLTTTFSQEKDELVLGFCREEAEFYIKAVLTPDFAALFFPETFQRARKNSVELFESAINCRVEEIIQYRNERSFGLLLEEDKLLLFKMHGKRANVILFDQGKVAELFHRKLVSDEKLVPESLHREIDQSYEAFLKHDCQAGKLFPTFGTAVNKYLEKEGFASKECPEKWSLVLGVLNRLEHPVFYLTVLDELPTLSLLPVGEIEAEITDPVEAANRFYLRYAKTSTLDREKRDALRPLEKKKHQTGNYLAKTYEKLWALENETRHEQIANILMANLSQVPSYAESVELYDFYHDRSVRIKLKKDQSVQRNAEIYYRKGKNEKIEIEILEKAIERKETELQKLDLHLEVIRNSNNLKELRKYLKENDLFEEAAAAEPANLFRQYEMMGFQVWMGRNAKNNDMLTVQYSRKDDLWLHAKDVSGSHVIIRFQSGQNFPEPVIEKAAALAAFHSKKRNDTLCPVTVTLRKYVRKPKGLPEGAVIVDKEKVIIVKPEDWKD